jgi:hypothetical protein
MVFYDSSTFALEILTIRTLLSTAQFSAKFPVKILNQVPGSHACYN